MLYFRKILALILSAFSLILSSCSNRKDIPEWVSFPSEQWEWITPKKAGLDTVKFDNWVNSQNPLFGKGFAGQYPGNGGVVIARGGYIIHTWGDPNFRYQSASLGKTFTRMALQLALDEGLIHGYDDLINKYWTGEGQLEKHKVLNHGEHQYLTFRHLSEMRGGFPVTNGFYWKDKANTGEFDTGIPDWTKWTGDPDYDNYAHVKPGKHRQYSSGGYWRLSQALTAVWNKDLKEVLDKKIMSKIGIPENRWEWISGEEVHNNIMFYPQLPGYGEFLDPPYEINGYPVRGGGGWVVMSAMDFARIGLLIATGGIWKGEQLISMIRGNVGVKANTVDGWGIIKGKEGFFSLGKVATGFQDPTEMDLASWILGPINK